MNKSVRVLLIWIIGIFVMVGCTKKEGIEPTQIAALNGPTGIGMIQLMEQEEYDITLYQSPDEIIGKVVSGEIDIACVPSNLAAILYNKTKGTDQEIGIMGINTLGVLYIVENGNSIQEIEDLRGKTIIASGKGSTPEFILNHLLKENNLEIGKDVEVTYMANHTDIASKLSVEEGTIALLPQPFVTTVQEKNSQIRMAIDLNKKWEELEGVSLPMGVAIVNKTYYEEAKQTIESFKDAYNKSVIFVNEQTEDAAKLVEEYKIIPNSKIAEKAIPKSNIVWITGNEAKEQLTTFYEILSKQNPKSVGGSLPDESFYME